MPTASQLEGLFLICQDKYYHVWDELKSKINTAIEMGLEQELLINMICTAIRREYRLENFISELQLLLDDQLIPIQLETPLPKLGEVGSNDQEERN